MTNRLNLTWEMRLLERHQVANYQWEEIDKTRFKVNISKIN